MKTTILAATLIIGTSFSAVSTAKGTSSIPAPAAAMSTSSNSQITDSVTQFKTVDKDGDGLITLAEAQAAGATEANFKKVDTNGDNHIDQKEYAIYLALDTTREHILFTSAR